MRSVELMFKLVFIHCQDALVEALTNSKVHVGKQKMEKLEADTLAAQNRLDAVLGAEAQAGKRLNDILAAEAEGKKRLLDLHGQIEAAEREAKAKKEAVQIQSEPELTLSDADSGIADSQNSQSFSLSSIVRDLDLEQFADDALLENFDVGLFNAC